MAISTIYLINLKKWSTPPSKTMSNSTAAISQNDTQLLYIASLNAEAIGNMKETGDFTRSKEYIMEALSRLNGLCKDQAEEDATSLEPGVEGNARLRMYVFFGSRRMVPPLRSG
jgi:hypothetical protein